MSRQKKRIVAIEPSAIVSQGLRLSLADYGFEWVACFPDFDAYAERGKHLAADFLLVNPAVFDFSQRGNIRSRLTEAGDALVVGLVYTPLEAENLKQYDAVISLWDAPARIAGLLERTLEERPEAVESGDNYELTDREREILAGVARGRTNKEIADSHHISVHTVISHRKNITRKTGIKSVSGLTVYALLNRLIEPAEIE